MAIYTERELRALTESNVGMRLREPGNLLGKVRTNRAGEVIVAFEYRYRSGNRQRSISVGTWPDDTLAAIRKQRDAYRVAVDQGGDPIESKKAAALTAKADQAEALAQAEARLAAAAAASNRMTVSELFDRWEKLALKSRKGGGAEVRRMFDKDVLPELGTMAVEDVKRRHIAAMLDKMKVRGIGRMVNLVLSLTRQMFRFAVSRDWIEADPTAALKKADFGGKEVERERVLSEDEIRELFAKLPNAKFIPATEAAIWIMLSTCCRVGEISQARWTDLDLAARRWRIPSDVAKNQREHIVALSDFATKHFEALKAIQTSPEWILPNAANNDHLDGRSITKQVRDRQRMTPLKGRSNCSAVLLLSRGEWTPHDLRRTGATVMRSLGVDGDVIEQCLNHIEQNRMKRIYQRHEHKVEKAEAWRLLGERLELLTRTDAENVVVITKRERGAA